MNLSVYLPFLKHKSVQLALGATLGILILLAVLSPRQSTSTPTPVLPSPFRPELQSISDGKRQASASYLSTIISKLPFYKKDISTSSNITTTYNIYRLESDPPETLRFEIYGLSYLNPDSSEFTNPNITAFKETFAEGIKALRDNSIDPSKIIFIYGDKQYVRDTATAWVKKYNLLP